MKANLMREPTREEKEAFWAEMQALPEPSDDSKPPFWEYWRHELWEHGLNLEDPGKFTEWPCVYHTMLHEHWPGVIAHIRAEMASPIYSDWWNTPLGRAYSFQRYSIFKWEEATGKRVTDLKRIFEFGGGYGAMAQVVSDLKFRGVYVICDLPEFQVLQKFYTNLVDAPVQFTSRTNGKYDLAIACYSLSETPMALRRNFEAKLSAKSYLFLYSNRFAEYDNLTYFKEFAERHPEYHWKSWRVEHMPPESWYLMGWLKEEKEEKEKKIASGSPVPPKPAAKRSRSSNRSVRSG